MTESVAAVIPSIPTRGGMLARALSSVATQTHPVDFIAVAIDHEHRGAGPTRNDALSCVKLWHLDDDPLTDWVAFLDDDDEWMPQHIETLLAIAHEHNADVIVPWFEMIGGNDPFPENRYLDFSEGMHSFPITCLVRADAIGSIAFKPPCIECVAANEDHFFWTDLCEAGAKFVKYPEPTWRWWYHGGNTSGRGDKW